MIHKHNSIVVAGLCAVGLALSAFSAHASITYTYNNIINPLVGSGNTSGGWTSAQNTDNGLTLSLRAQSSVDGSTANSSGVYTYPTGAAASGPDAGNFNWDFWFDVNAGSKTTQSYAYFLTISSIGTGGSGTVLIATHWPLDNGYTGGWFTSSEFQNAENLSFLDANLNPDDIASYQFTLDAYSIDWTPQLVDSVSIIVNNGQRDGNTVGAVPEPSTYAAAGLMLLPLGMALLKTIRRKQVAVEKSNS